MKTVKNKQILMAADFAGYPLKEAIKEYLEKKGWTVTDISVSLFARGQYIIYIRYTSQ